MELTSKYGQIENDHSHNSKFKTDANKKPYINYKKLYLLNRYNQLNLNELLL